MNNAQSCSVLLPLQCGKEVLPVSLGTMVGRHDDSCLGAQYAMDPNNWIAACNNNSVPQCIVTCKPEMYNDSLSVCNVTS
jgi:hypothetical protein